jgi:hypothetical protein
MEQKINKVNYKSDFDLLATMKCYDTQGKEIEIGFANYDWELDLCTGCGNYAPKVYKVSYIGGKATNCFNDNGKVHIVCDNHGLNLGVLNGTIRAKIPNAIYPDGTQLIVSPLTFAIELVADGGDTPSPIEVEIMLPYLYDSIYRIAQQGGYDGTQEEYYQLVSQLPNAVETANKVQESADSLADSAESIGGAIETLASTTDVIEQGASTIANSATKVEESVAILEDVSTTIGDSATNINALTSLVSDWAEGKTKIADALTRKYSPTEASESFDAMAQKVMDLPLAVEGQEGIIDQTANGIIDGYDLLNELHQHQRQDYPYCCGVEFTSQQYKSIILSGAEAYLCSDGFFTTEQEVEHTFAEDNKLSHYIIYYFSYPTYQIPTQINYALRIVAYNGQPRFVMSNIWCPLVQSFTNERYSVGTAELDINSGGCISSVMLCGISEYAGTISGGQNNAMMTSVALPHLEVLNGGYISKTSDNLKSVSIPNLRVVNGGTILYNTGVESLSLPSLEVVNGGTDLSRGGKLKEINLPNLREWRGGWLNYGSSKLEKLSFPNLEFCQPTSGFLQYAPPVLHFPKLKFASNLIAQVQRVGGAGTIDLYLPAIEGDFTHGSISGANVYVAVHLGNQQGKNISMAGETKTRVSSITVEDGFRSGLNISGYSHLDASVIEDIIDHLADNNDYEPLTLTLGTTLKNKLSEEYIAIATAKNYNIA